MGTILSIIELIFACIGLVGAVQRKYAIVKLYFVYMVCDVILATILQLVRIFSKGSVRSQCVDHYYQSHQTMSLDAYVNNCETVFVTIGIVVLVPYLVIVIYATIVVGSLAH